MIDDFSYGVIPYYFKDEQAQFLLIRHQKGHWDFPKGHQQANETDLQTAKRELAEETSLTNVELQTEPNFWEKYIYNDQNNQTINKTVKFFLGKAIKTNITIQPSEIADFGWFNFDQAMAKITFEQGKRLLNDANTYLCQKKP